MKRRRDRRSRKHNHGSAPHGSPPAAETPPASRILVRRGAAAVVLVLIVASLFHLRMKPSLGRAIDLQLDAAFNYRMTYDLLKDGAVPANDPLSTYPEGKPVTELLPTGIYYACAAFDWVIELFASPPLKTVVLLFCALCGSLIAFPVYFVSMELYRSRPIALVSAALAGMIPLSMERTLCYWYRDEILAVPILFMSFLFFLKMFDSTGDRNAVLNGSISMALLVAAFYVWRLCALVLVAYVVSVVSLAFRGAKNTRKVVIAGLLLLCFCVVLLLFIPGFGRWNPESHYGGFPRAVLEIGLSRLGIRTEFSGFTRLVSDNQELWSVTPREMIGWKELSLSPGFLLMFLAISFRRKERSAQKDILCVFVLLFGVLGTLVYRNLVFLGPLAAITAGESLSIVRDPGRRKTVRYAVLAVTLFFGIRTGLDGSRMASAYHTDVRVGRSLEKIIDKIRELVPHGSAVACYWADGYMVQSYCSRPTLTDGLFESREIVSRILEESKAFYSDDENDLWNYCTRHGASYLLVPVKRTESYAHQAGVEYEKYFDAEGPTVAGRATVLYRVIHDPGSLQHFHELYRDAGYVLFQVLGPGAPPGGAPS